MTKFTVACVQTNTGLEMEPAIAALRPMVSRAREMGGPSSTPCRWALCQRMVMARRALSVSSWWPET